VDSTLCVRLHARRAAPREETWLPAARMQESWALERFYHTYQSQVYSLCYRMVGRSEDAEDAMQATFIRAFRDLPRFRGDSSLKTWVYRIAVNEALTTLRRRRESPELDEEQLRFADGAPSVVEKLAVQAAISRLSVEHRMVLTLRFWEGLDCQEIAHVLGISLPAAKMRLHRAREEFRKRYEDAE
jgi:RNA polymerase sigma-70 factor, ECF subfamily